MTSIASRTRQNAPSHYMPLSSLEGLIYAYNPTTKTTEQFVAATWASSGITQTDGQYYSSVRQAGAGILTDLGKQVISSGRIFRKVQLVVRNGAVAARTPTTGANSTFGVAGTATGAALNQDFLTGYIELGYEGTGPATPVAQYGTL